MKQSGCCYSCSLTRLSFLLAGHVVAREVEVNYDDFMTGILDDISGNNWSAGDIDNTFELFRDCDTTTKLIAGVKVPGVPDSIARVFKNNLNTKRFCRAWKTHLQDVGFLLFTPKDFEPFLKSQNIQGLPPKIALMAPVIEKELYDFVKIAREQDVFIICSEDTVLHNKKMRQWELEFVHDIGRTFVSSPRDFFVFQNFYDNREHDSLYRTPNLAKILARMDMSAEAYADSGALKKILAVAEVLSKISTGNTFNLTRTFASSSPPIFGLLSRFPDNLTPLDKQPTNGTLVESTFEGELIYTGTGFYIIGSTPETNNSVNFTRIAHSILANPSPLQPKGFEIQGGISLKRTRFVGHSKRDIISAR